MILFVFLLLGIVAFAAVLCGLAGSAAARRFALPAGDRQFDRRRLRTVAGMAGGLAASGIIGTRSWAALTATGTDWLGIGLGAAMLLGMTLRERQGGSALRPWRVAAVTAAGIAIVLLLLLLCLTPFENFLASLNPILRPDRPYELPEVGIASASQADRYERSLPSIFDQLSAYNDISVHGAFHRADDRLERKLWRILSTLKTYDNGGQRLLEAIDRIYLAYHDNGYSGWPWHYPYLDCFKAVALARKLQREYQDPTLREEALWREATCYRFRGIDDPSDTGLERSNAVRALASWRSDLGRTRELLEQLVDRFPTGAHAEEAAAYLLFGIAEIEKPGGFPAFETWTRLLLRDCSALSDLRWEPALLRRVLRLPYSPRQRCEVLRGIAAGGLGNLGDQRGVTVLVSVLADTDLPTRARDGSSLQKHAILALRSLDPRRASELRRELGVADDLGLFDFDLEVPSTAAIPHLLAQLSPAADHNDRRIAAGLLIEIEIATGEVVPRLVPAYAAGQIDLRAAARVLGSDRISRRLLPPVTEALGHPDPEVRGRLALLLARFADAQAMGLTSGRLTTARQAEAEARLREFLDDPDAGVRRQAAHALRDLLRPVAPETSARLTRLAEDGRSP